MKKRQFAAIIKSFLLFLCLPAALFANHDTKCDIQHGSCSATAQDGTVVEFDIQPKPVVALSELRFIVKVKQPKGKKISSTELDLSMPGMFMGKNEPVLRHMGNGTYEGKGIIPRCMSGRKTWQAAVSTRQEDTLSNVVFVFEVQ